MGGKKYHVTKTPTGWEGRREDATRASVKAPTRDEAIQRTIAIAKNQFESIVVVHYADGMVQQEIRFEE